MVSILILFCSLSHLTQFNYRLPEGKTILQKKGCGCLIHVSEYINLETGHLVHLGPDGSQILDKAQKIIYPRSNGDAWWDMDQLLVQTKHAIKVFKKQFSGCVALFIYDQSSAHGSLGPDALRASSMNKTDGGKQQVQCNTTIPMSNPNPDLRGQPQKMMLDDRTPKGMQVVLTERGYDVSGLKVHCSPVCLVDSPEHCCMSQLLNQEEDFANQESMLEKLICEAVHLCIFLPKFYCKLNPIEMVFST
jgi:hypothetical protein